MARRRLLRWWIPLSAVVVLAVVAGVAAFVLHRPAEPEMKTKIYLAPQHVQGPVLLVPGYGGDASVLTALAERIRASGRTVEVFAPPDRARGDLRTQARALAAVAKKLRGNAPSVDIVGYSAGGVVARLWLRDFGGAPMTRRVVTIGSPHHGTELAGLAYAVATDTCPTACQQLAAHSSLITGLNRGDETPDGPLWTTMWTAYDDVVVPPVSGQLKGAIGTELQKVCPDDRVRHGSLPEDPLVIGIVLRSIGLDSPVRPQASDCDRLRQAAAVEG